MGSIPVGRAFLLSRAVWGSKGGPTRIDGAASDQRAATTTGGPGGDRSDPRGFALRSNASGGAEAPIPVGRAFLSRCLAPRRSGVPDTGQGIEGSRSRW